MPHQENRQKKPPGRPLKEGGSNLEPLLHSLFPVAIGEGGEEADSTPEKGPREKRGILVRRGKGI